jgi:hypothetical protein
VVAVAGTLVLAHPARGLEVHVRRHDLSLCPELVHDELSRNSRARSAGKPVELRVGSWIGSPIAPRAGGAASTAAARDTRRGSPEAATTARRQHSLPAWRRKRLDEARPLGQTQQIDDARAGSCEKRAQGGDDVIDVQLRARMTTEHIGERVVSEDF